MPSHSSIPKSIHFTDEADAFHKDKCVSRTMAHMSDPTKCIGYMAGVSEGNPKMARVTIADLRAHCAAKEATFTIADAEALCSGLNEAHASFWSDRASPDSSHCHAKAHDAS